MRPLILKGHDRPITDCQFNHDGDLIFTAGKDALITVWSAENGERLGTYEDAKAAVNCISVNRNSTRLLTASAFAVELWDVESGKKLNCYQHDYPVKTVAFAEGDQKFLTVTDTLMGTKPFIHVYPVQDDAESKSRGCSASFQAEIKTGRVLKAIWGFHNQTIITANEDGTVRTFDTETAKEMNCIFAHEKQVSDIHYDKYKILFITASKDGTAKLWDSRAVQPIKTFDVGRPLNAAAISPLMDHVIVGGGESAMEVTLTAASSEQFKVRFFHSIMGHELGSVLGHFGPVNSLDFSPDGRSFISGAEDGFVRLHYMDESYFKRTEEIRQFK